MPIIVPIEENKLGLATATDAKFRAPDTSGSGLEALGAGLAQLGGGAQQLASGIEERRRRAAEAIAAAMLDDRHQSSIDDAAVKNAYVDYSDLTHDALHGDDGLFNRQGADAHAAFPGVVEKLVDNHDQALSKLDDVQRAVVAPAMNERLRSDVGRAAEHVRQQGAVEQKWQSEQLQKAAARDAVNHADDPDLFDHHLATGENAIRQQAKIDNIGDKLLARQIADYKSTVHADTIEALARRDPVHAAGWYARYGDDLNQRDKLRVESTLGPALADARAVADVDAAGSAGDPTMAPVNPHAGNNATLLLKMQGITPTMDRTALPALMQRYGNDPAKAWAAFEAGPETIDRLIAQRGDDWYAGVGDDTRRFVGGNMRMLDLVGSPRRVSAEAPTSPHMMYASFSTTPSRIPKPRLAADPRIEDRVDNLAIDDPSAALLDVPAPTPVAVDAMSDGIASLGREMGKPSGPLFAPIKSGKVGSDMVLAATVDPKKYALLSGRDVIATPTMKAAAAAQIGKVRVQQGDHEIMAFGYLMPDGSIEVRPTGTPGSTSYADFAHAKPSGPGRAIFVIHGHIEKTLTSDREPSNGMVDDTGIASGRGDADGLYYRLPVATVYNGHIGWHEMRNGQLIFTVPDGAQSPHQLSLIQDNLSSEQKKFFIKQKGK